MAASQQLVQEWEAASVSRYWAAEVLYKFAEAGRAGLFPTDVTWQDLGRALHRICINRPVENPESPVGESQEAPFWYGWDEGAWHFAGPEAFAEFRELDY